MSIYRVAFIAYEQAMYKYLNGYVDENGFRWLMGKWMHLNKNKAQRKDTWQVNTLSLTTNIIERITENEKKFNTCSIR